MKVIKQEAIVYRMIFCDYKSNELIDFCNVMIFPVWRGNDKIMVYDVVEEMYDIKQPTESGLMDLELYYVNKYRYLIVS